ncbi:DUF1638 domain-containing protein [Methanolobus sp. ZRKC3]|uniref:DUF1638 domain-containing protein n=1 Tax=Methanolobus sp. ZRKC3 TaxID=3125786 RepID=UPI0032557474
MPLVSIIGCELFTKELAELLAKDDNIDRLAVVNGRSQLIINDLKDLGIEPEVISSDSLPAGLNKDNGFNIIVTLQSSLLHNDIPKLKKETYEKIKFYGNISDSILLFYGSCDGAFNNIFSDFKKPGFSLKALFKEDDSLVDTSIDNCASFLADSSGINSQMLEIYDRCYGEIKKDLLV